MPRPWAVPPRIARSLPVHYRCWLWWIRRAPRRGVGVLGGSALFRRARAIELQRRRSDHFVTLDADAAPSRLVVDLLDFQSFQHTIPLWLGRSGEHELIARHLRPGDVFLDVGASYGVFSLYAASLRLPGVRVLAVEPQPRLAEAIRRSAAANGFAAVEIAELVAGEAEGIASFYYRSIGSGTGSRSREVAGHYGEPQALSTRRARIDDLLAERKVDGLDLVKVDVEGFESEVFAGARESLRRYHPIVWFEHNPRALALREPPARSAMEELRLAGYRRFVRLGDASAFEPGGLDSEGYVNVLATPD